MTNTSQSDQPSTEYLLQELNNSFEHSRHLEQQINNYLAFYLAFLIGSISIVASFLENIEQSSFALQINLSFIVILLVNSVIGVSLFSLVVKLRYAINRHVSKIAWIRNILDLKKDLSTHEEMCGIFGSNHPAFKKSELKLSIFKNGFSVKSSNEFILLFIVLSIFSGSYWFIREQFYASYKLSYWISLILWGLIVLYLIFVLIQTFRFKKYTKDLKNS